MTDQLEAAKRELLDWINEPGKERLTADDPDGLYLADYVRGPTDTVLRWRGGKLFTTDYRQSELDDMCRNFRGPLTVANPIIAAVEHTQRLKERAEQADQQRDVLRDALQELYDFHNAKNTNRDHRYRRALAMAEVALRPAD